MRPAADRDPQKAIISAVGLRLRLWRRQAAGIESLRQCAAKGYPATIFRRMRHDYGTERAMAKVVESGEIQSGFKRLQRLVSLRTGL
jgi:hypothetical protein